MLDTFFQANNFLHPGLKILDAGCGTGLVTKVLFHLAQQQGLEDIAFYGFDFTLAMLALFHVCYYKSVQHQPEVCQVKNIQKSELFAGS